MHGSHIMSRLVTPVLLLLLGWCSVHVRAQGCSWTGRMPGPGGSGPCPRPMQSETCPVTPSYDEVRGLWPCPAYDRAAGQQYFSSSCTVGGGSNPLCNFNPSTPQFGCCCPSDGCWVPPTFNWIIGRDRHIILCN